MVGVRSSLAQLGAELLSLIQHTGRTIARLWVPLLALMLLGWSAQQLSILLATEVSEVWAWGVILVLAAGAVIQLTTIVALLRLVAVTLGLPQMLSEAADAAAVQDDRDTSLVSLVTITLLPFLGMYVAFGYLQNYAARVSVLAGYRKGLGDLLGALNPLENNTTMIVMVTILVAGYAFKKLIDPWKERSRRPLILTSVQILVEACLAFVVLLGGFRLYQEFNLWLDSRNVSAWWAQVVATLLGPIPAAVKDAISLVWQAVGGPFWSLLINGLARPLLWLAMAGLVVGSRVLTLADLWRVGRPATSVRTPRERLLARLQAESESARGTRAIALKLQSSLLGGVDSRIIPAWQSLRLVLRAGWPLFGAFVICFTALDLFGQQADLWVTHLIGGQLIGVWIKLYPFMDLISMVLVMGVTWVLLGVTYTRALSIFADNAGQGVHGVLAPATVGVRRAFRAGPLQAITVIVVASAVVVAASAAPTTYGEQVVPARLENAADLHGQQVLVSAPEVVRTITVGSRILTTDGVFVVVPITVAKPLPGYQRLMAKLTVGDRSYPAWSAFGPPVAPSGFRAGEDMVFEVDPADVARGARLVISTVGESRLLRGYQKVLVIDLGLTANSLATAVGNRTVSDLPVLGAA